MVTLNESPLHEVSWLTPCLVTQSERGKELASKPHAEDLNILL